MSDVPKHNVVTVLFCQCCMCSVYPIFSSCTFFLLVGTAIDCPEATAKRHVLVSRTTKGDKKEKGNFLDISMIKT